METSSFKWLTELHEAYQKYYMKLELTFADLLADLIK